MAAPAAQAAPGALDPLFDTDGKLTTPIGTTGVKRDELRAVAIQADGKIVVAGFTSPSDNLASADFVLARYHPNGSLDSTCDGDGKAIVTQFEIAEAVAIQDDGKIVVGGSGGAFADEGFALARFNPADCSLDTTFSGDGRVAATLDRGTTEAKAVAIQDDGKIVAAGWAVPDFGLVRFNSDGTLDTACDGDGKVTTDFASTFDDAEALAIQSDDKLVVAGQSNFNFALARYNAADCSLDGGFDGDGRLTTDIALSDKAWALQVQTDGKLVAAGRADGDFDFALVRYQPNGSLDATCDGDGKVTTDFAPTKQDNAFALQIQADGKLVAAGDADLSPGGFTDVDRDFALARYNPDCSLDNTFDGDGTLTTDIGDLNQIDTADGLAVQPDGKLAAVGRADMGPPEDFDFDFALARYLGDGYPRPKGATPLRASLVPAYNACSAPNRTHGPPLAYGSCNPPAPSTGWLTVGTADANGEATNSVGSVRLSVVVGNPGTPADEADVQMTASVSDVRNMSDLTDYAGELQVRSALVRITDKLNGTSQTENGTVQNTTFPVTVPCAPTASATIGSTCSITTSYDAVVSGAIKEGKRTVWELGRILVHDGGADGLVSTSPNFVFAGQGVFVP